MSDLIMLTLLLGCFGIMACNGLNDTTPPSDEPAKAAKALIAAAQSGDLAAYTALLGPHDAASAQFALAQDAMNAAVKSRFGEAPVNMPTFAASVRDAFAGTFEIRGAETVTAGVALTVWQTASNGAIQESRWLATRDGEAWRLALPDKSAVEQAERTRDDGSKVTVDVVKSAVEPRNDGRAAILRQRTDALRKVTSEIQAGRFATIDELSKRMQELKRETG